MSYLIPFFILVGPLILFVWILQGYAFLTTQRDRRTPLVQNLLRAPGQSLQEQLDERRSDVLSWFTLVPAIPIFVYAMFLQYRLFDNGSDQLLIPGGLAVAALGFWAYALVRMIRHLPYKRRLELGIDAEMAAGQELNQLMHDGYWVFHDLPAKDFNIDHVLVGKNGVFAVETKGRPKRFGGGNRAAQVIYDGEALTFPEWRETKPIEQAKYQAKWLSGWLSSSVGECIEVQPVLILLGWFIKKTGPQGIAVVSGREVRSYLSRMRGTELSEKQIQQVRHQLDQRCRNVEPKAYQATRIKGIKGH